MPRLKELLDVSKSENMKTPSLTIYFENHLSRNGDAVFRIAKSLVHVTLQNVLESWHMTSESMDPELLALQQQVETKEVQVHEEYLRIVLNKTKMQAHCIEPYQVEDALYQQPIPLHIVTSEVEMNEWVVLVRLLKKKKPLSLDEWEALIRFLPIQGSKRITGAFSREAFCTKVDKSTGTIVREKEYVIDTNGTDLEYILGVDGIDFARTFSNDVCEIHRTLGVEAARAGLYDELTMVLTFDGNYLNSRHLALLADSMTSLGFLCSVSRHGMKRAQVGPLLRASFEETADVFFESALYGAIDPCKSMTSNIMFGKYISSGTGSFGVLKAKSKKAPLFLGKTRSKKKTQQPPRTCYWNPYVNPLLQVDRFLNNKHAAAVANSVMAYIPPAEMMMPGTMMSTNEGDWKQSGMMMASFPEELGMMSGCRPTSPMYSPTSPMYSPTSPATPTSPLYSPNHPPSPKVPAYDEESTALHGPYEPLQTVSGTFNFDRAFVPMSPPLVKKKEFVPMSPPWVHPG